MLWLLLACIDCPAFEDLVVTGDESGEIASVVAEFAAWTGRDGVCVPRIDVVEVVADDADVAGRFVAPGEPIEIAASNGSVARVVRHELCHALDAVEGLADPLAGTLDADAVDPVRYADDELRRAEAFALVCEAGPAEVDFAAALEARCGVPADPAAVAVREPVYPDAPAPAAVEIGDDPSLSALAELGPGRVVAVAGGARGAWLRLETPDGDAERWWSADGAPEEAVGAWADGGAVAGDGAWAWTWYERGVAGVAVGTAQAWTLRTDCGLSTSGALPSWIGGEPAWFTEAGVPVVVR